MKLYIFDFDGTLFHTPTDDIGKDIWFDKTGREWHHIGWWSKVETLDDNIFDIPLNRDVYNEYLKIDRKDSKVFLATGRLNKVPGMMDSVKNLCHREGLEFDGLYLSNGDTFKFKSNLFEKLIEKYNPDILTMYDDRESHIELFKEWALYQKCPIKIVDVVNGDNFLINDK
jgi:FMN phosphatase YigB (HAD superfamily)